MHRVKGPHWSSSVSILISNQGSSLRVLFIEIGRDVHSLYGQMRISQRRKETGQRNKNNSWMLMTTITEHLCPQSCYRWKTIFHEEQSSINCEELWKKYSVVNSLPPDGRYHCPRCGVLLLNSDLAEHEGHGTRSGVSDEELLEPTCLVTPKDNKKSQAVRT